VERGDRVGVGVVAVSEFVAERELRLGDEGMPEGFSSGSIREVYRSLFGRIVRGLRRIQPARAVCLRSP
jgi:hypothetical protein